MERQGVRGKSFGGKGLEGFFDHGMAIACWRLTPGHEISLYKSLVYFHLSIGAYTMAKKKSILVTASDENGQIISIETEYGTASLITGMGGKLFDAPVLSIGRYVGDTKPFTGGANKWAVAMANADIIMKFVKAYQKTSGKVEKEERPATVKKTAKELFG